MQEWKIGKPWSRRRISGSIEARDHSKGKKLCLLHVLVCFASSFAWRRRARSLSWMWKLSKRIFLKTKMGVSSKNPDLQKGPGWKLWPQKVWMSKKDIRQRPRRSATGPSWKLGCLLFSFCLFVCVWVCVSVTFLLKNECRRRLGRVHYTEIWNTARWYISVGRNIRKCNEWT